MAQYYLLHVLDSTAVPLLFAASQRDGWRVQTAEAAATRDPATFVHWARLVDSAPLILTGPPGVDGRTASQWVNGVLNGTAMGRVALTEPLHAQWEVLGGPQDGEGGQFEPEQGKDEDID